MPRVKLIGKPIDQYGKTLWEILGNLKNFGVDRLITRGMQSRYKEPCFIKIVKVIPVAEEPEPGYNVFRKVIVWVESTFRGRKNPELVEIFGASPKWDYRLIPKDEEHLWYERVKQCEKKYKKTISEKLTVPPLLNLFLKKQMEKKGEIISDDPIKIPVVFRKGPNNIVVFAKDGEEPDIKCDDSFGEVLSPTLYDNIEVTKEYFTRQRRFTKGEELI